MASKVLKGRNFLVLRVRVRRAAVLLSAVAAALVPGQSQAQIPPSYTVTTFAGIGTAGYDADTSTASTVQFNNPYSIFVDKSGVIWVADQANSRIRKIGTDKAVTLVAGVGTNGSAGDDASATAAQLYYPCGLVVDGSGNILIADTNNNRIRKVVPGGNITTIAGTGNAGFLDQTTDSTDPLSVAFDKPVSLGLDSSGTLYIVDTFNHRIRKMAADGKITTVVGTGDSAYTGDGGLATAATISYPQSIVWDTAGNLYVSDSGNHVIRKVTADGTIHTIAGNGLVGFSGDGGPATSASLNTPKGMAFDSAGNLFFADSFNGRIRVVKTDGTIATIAGNGGYGDDSGGAPAYSSRLRFPSWVAIAPNGGLYVVDNQNHKIKLLTPSQDSVQPTQTPSINSGQVTTAAAFGASPNIAPGSWIEIFGVNYALNARSWTSGDFTGNAAPVSLDGIWATIAGKFTYVSYVSPNQMNVQVPSDVPPGPQNVVVGTPGGTSRAYPINVKAAQPGFWAPPIFNINGKQYLGAILPDGKYALPANSVAGIESRPARPGEILVAYGTGFGTVNPPVIAGQIVTQPNSLDLPLSIQFGGASATTSYAGLAVNYVGLYQFNIAVPVVDSNDAVPVTFTLGGVLGDQKLYIAIQN